ATDDIGIVENIAGQSLPARPGEGPEGRRKAVLLKLFLSHLPDRHNLAGKMQPDFRNEGRFVERRVAADKIGRIADGAHSSLASAARMARAFLLSLAIRARKLSKIGRA